MENSAGRRVTGSSFRLPSPAGRGSPDWTSDCVWKALGGMVSQVRLPPEKVERPCIRLLTSVSLATWGLWGGMVSPNLTSDFRLWRGEVWVRLPTSRRDVLGPDCSLCCMEAPGSNSRRQMESGELRGRRVPRIGLPTSASGGGTSLDPPCTQRCPRARLPPLAQGDAGVQLPTLDWKWRRELCGGKVSPGLTSDFRLWRGKVIGHWIRLLRGNVPGSECRLPRSEAPRSKCRLQI